MSGVNKAILLGRVGKDPEGRTLEIGKTVASFSIATSEKYKDKSGQTVEQTEWHNITVWGGLADVALKYVKKGDLIYIEGKITTRKWEKDGVTQYTTEIVGQSLQMLGSKKTEGNTAPLAGKQPVSAPIEEDDLPY